MMKAKKIFMTFVGVIVVSLFLFGIKAAEQEDKFQNYIEALSNSDPQIRGQAVIAMGEITPDVKSA
ncbi:MAG: hypothetical protein U9N73_11995 [Candidatus Auribacterota bacterium]|nr:hypothetical protein [Candidatus Auribacterota bacterium]